MAVIRPTYQNYTDTKTGTTIGIHIVTPVTTSDTFTVPMLANSTVNVSSATLRRADGNTATVTNDGANTITVAGTVGDTVLIVTVHPARVGNYGPEVAV